jgi:hypothetical protein
LDLVIGDTCIVGSFGASLALSIGATLLQFILIRGGLILVGLAFMLLINLLKVIFARN